MCIEEHFSYSYRDPPYGRIISQNKDIVRMVFDAFNVQEKLYIETHNILVFFDDTCDGSLGFIIKRDFAEYQSFISRYGFEISTIMDFQSFDFIVGVSREITVDDDREYKALTIAHEFQHVFQWIFHERLIVQDFLIKKTWRINNINDSFNLAKHKLPCELDADKKAVQIGKCLFGDNYIRDKIDGFDQESIIFPLIAERKAQWEQYEKISIAGPYPLELEAGNTWTKWEEEVNRIANIVRNKTEAMTDDERKFQEAYRYYEEIPEKS